MNNGVWGKAPEAGEFSRISVIKVTIQSVRLVLTKLQKNGGAGCNKFVGEQLLLTAPAALPVPAPMQLMLNAAYCCHLSTDHMHWPLKETISHSH